MMNSIFHFTLLCIWMLSLTTASNTTLQNLFKRMPFDKYLIVKSPAFPSQSASSRLQCSALCARNNFCRYFTYERSNSKCSLLHSWNDTLAVQSSSDSQTYYSIDEGNIWNMIYFVKSDVNINVTTSFSEGGISGCQSPVVNSKVDVASQTTEENDKCSNYYRSNLIDIWNNLPIAKVKLVIKKDSEVAVSLVFDGRDSTKQSWFDVSKIVDSPWPFEANNTRLQFAMNKFTFVYAIKKEEKAFWMTISTIHQDLKLLSPVILFSNTTTFSYSTDGILGDSLTIYVSFEKQPASTSDKSETVDRERSSVKSK
ncbi:uncharacterized protein LOC106874130 [Octopus bimaculoides]|uniref:Apple domain-containing protein n=1 Tax=Octopus bimaculoides TaxID=37653 RepID=A0A0L8GXG5_OCTBM|nr:uncharacterized protein LOC106874130 [Octopus bimaculoides]|eukprot:XP_014777229.1 PREDICTED: uncharacterized protein LOC106874130 [Octopus bimaculoides]